MDNLDLTVNFYPHNNHHLCKAYIVQFIELIMILGRVANSY